MISSRSMWCDFFSNSSSIRIYIALKFAYLQNAWFHSMLAWLVVLEASFGGTKAKNQDPKKSTFSKPNFWTRGSYAERLSTQRPSRELLSLPCTRQHTCGSRVAGVTAWVGCTWHYQKLYKLLIHGTTSAVVPWLSTKTWKIREARSRKCIGVRASYLESTRPCACGLVGSIDSICAQSVCAGSCVWDIDRFSSVHKTVQTTRES